MVFEGIQREDLPKKYLEISLWSFNIYAAHDFLGQVVVHLSGQFRASISLIGMDWRSMFV